MYTENGPLSLQSSSSLPYFRPNAYGRPTYADSQQGSSFNGQQTQPKMGTLEPNSYKLNNIALPENAVDAKKGEAALNLFASLKLSETTENKKYAVTHSQIQEVPQTYRFQFKRNTANGQTVSFRQDTKRQGNNSSFDGYQQATSSNILPNFGPNPHLEHKNGNTQRESEESKSRQLALEKKVKELENQLKFEEKYANDLYKSLEESKKETVNLQETNSALLKQLESAEAQIKQLTQELKYSQQLYRTLFDEREQLKIEISSNIKRISSLESAEQTNLSTISTLNEKIDNFSNYYRNELYEERIKQLNEELCSSRNSLTEAVVEKIRLSEELKFKNDKLACMMYDSPAAGKPSRPIHPTEKTNEAINAVFEESIKLYQKDIQSLKEIIERQNEEHTKLRDENIEKRKEIEALKQDQRIANLKLNTEKRNIAQQKDVKLIEKTNQVTSLSNRIRMIEERYATALKEIDQKDQFLQQHLVGRAKDLELKEYIEQTMKEYVQTFESRRALEERVNFLQKQLEKQ